MTTSAISERVARVRGRVPMLHDDPVHRLPRAIQRERRAQSLERMQIVDEDAHLPAVFARELPREAPAHADVAEIVDHRAENIAGDRYGRRCGRFDRRAGRRAVKRRSGGHRRAPADAECSKLAILKHSHEEAPVGFSCAGALCGARPTARRFARQFHQPILHDRTRSKHRIRAQESARPVAASARRLSLLRYARRRAVRRQGARPEKARVELFHEDATVAAHRDDGDAHRAASRRP